MEIKDFIENFADQFDDTDMGEFVPNTKFKELEEWSSLTALSIIAMVDEEYGYSLKGEEMSQVSTIEDLFNLINDNTNE